MWPFTRRKNKWRDLLKDPPTGNETCVVLFPTISDVGILFTTSNPHYAKANGLKNGYTHWMELDNPPTYDLAIEQQESVRGMRYPIDAKDDMNARIMRRLHPTRK